MFKTLDTVKWETLETQFGYASEIPKLNILEVSATNTDVLDGLNDMPFMRGCIGRDRRTPWQPLGGLSEFSCMAGRLSDTVRPLPGQSVRRRERRTGPSPWPTHVAA